MSISFFCADKKSVDFFQSSVMMMAMFITTSSFFMVSSMGEKSFTESLSKSSSLSLFVNRRHRQNLRSLGHLLLNTEKEDTGHKKLPSNCAPAILKRGLSF
jgi:hypothetical protein